MFYDAALMNCYVLCKIDRNRESINELKKYSQRLKLFKTNQNS